MTKRRMLMRVVLVSLLATVAAHAVMALLFSVWLSPQPMRVGATFSHVHAEQLGLDWQEAYLAVLDELPIQAVRVPVYWNVVEPAQDQYDFSATDWMLDRAAERGIAVTLAIGQKVPRWPECYVPDWADVSSPAHRQDVLDLIAVTVERYKHHPALERWQIENEFFFPFGACPIPDATLYAAERDLVRALDSAHPIQLTTSGEQAFWTGTALPADVLGVSLYRVTWNELAGYIVFPYRPMVYALQQTVAGLFAQEVIISELQAEPWLGSVSQEWDMETQYRAFDARDLTANLWFAQRTRAREVYVWGVEWWYYLYAQGDARLWSAGIVELHKISQ